MKGNVLLITNQAPDQEEHSHKECNHKYDLKGYDQFKFKLMPVCLHYAFFSHVIRQKFDGYIEQ